MDNKNPQEQFYSAFIDMQHELPIIDKSSEVSFNGNVQFTYAALDDIQKAIRPVLKEYGFGYKQWIVAMPDGVHNGIKTQIKHRGGYSEAEVCKLPLILLSDCPRKKDGEIDIGKLKSIEGGHVTYYKRYALCSALGIICTNEDQDAAPADAVINKKPTSTGISMNNITDKQLGKLRFEMGKNPEVSQVINIKYPDLSQIPKDSFNKILAMLNPEEYANPEKSNFGRIN